MKNLKYFLGMLLIASVVGVISCKDKDDDKKPDFTADYPEAPTVAGKITIFAKFEAGLCQNGVVVLNGSHNLVEGGTAWRTDNPTAMPTFVSAGIIDGKDWGAEGWWKVTVDLKADAAYPDKGSGAILGAKPVHLKDGQFFWDYQIGYTGVADVEVKSGDIFLDPKAENKECDIFFESNATAAIIFKKWKNDPCVVSTKYDVTFSVTVPASTPNDAVVRIVGSFGTSGYSDWGQNAEDMILTKGADGKYSIKLNLNEGDIQYKYVLNGSWDFEEFTDNCTSISNRKVAVSGVATVNDVVNNWKGFGDCAPSSVTHDYTFVVTVPEGTPEDAVVRIVGDFGNAGYPSWNQASDEMILVKGADGTYSITLNDVGEGTEYKYVLNGNWDFEERGANDGSDCAPGIGSNRKTPASEDDEVTVEDTVENWKGVTTCIPVPITATENTWEIGDQIWTDYIVYDGKGKVAAGTITNYAGTNTVGDYRNNPGYKGYMYNLPYIQANEDKLCPAPWRVPSPQDIIDLDIALGGDGTNYHIDAGTAGSAHDPNIGIRVQRYVDEFGWEFSGRVYADGSLNNVTSIGNLSTNAGASETVTVDGASFTVENYTNRPSHLCVKSDQGDKFAVFPQNEANSSNQKERAFPVRCVRDAD